MTRSIMAHPSSMDFTCLLSNRPGKSQIERDEDSERWDADYLRRVQRKIACNAITENFFPGYALFGSGRISSGKMYSSPAAPKFTRISWRPMFSIARTKVPSRGRTTPVLCDRIGLFFFKRFAGFVTPTSRCDLLSCLRLTPSECVIGSFSISLNTPCYFLDAYHQEIMQTQNQSQ